METPLGWRVTWNHYPAKITGAPKMPPHALDFDTKEAAEAKKGELLRRYESIVATVTPIYLSKATRSRLNTKSQANMKQGWPLQARTL